MLNRPSVDLPVTYAPYRLDDRFPVYLEHSIQENRLITWLHLHNCLEIGYCHEGSGIFLVEGMVLPFGPGDVVAIGKEEAHLASSLPNTLSRWSFILLDPSLLLGAAMLPIAEGVSSLSKPRFTHAFDPGGHARLTGLVSDILDELNGREEGYRDAVRGLVLALMVYLGRAVEGRNAEAAEGEKTGIERIAPALAYIARNYAKPIGLGALAELCHASERTVRRWFVEMVNDPPQRYISRIRLGMASALLRGSSCSVTEIAYQVGYSSPSSFARHFREMMGLSPCDWRGMHREGWV